MNVEQRKRLSSQQQSTVNRLALPKKRDIVVSISGETTNNTESNHNGKEVNRASTPQSLVNENVNENQASTNNKDLKKVSFFFYLCYKEELSKNSIVYKINWNFFNNYS